MKHYLSTPEEVFKETSSSEKGLTSEQAQKRLEENGKNRLEEGKKKSVIRRLLEQFADPMIIILIVAAAISGITAAFEGGFPSDVIIILFVVILNAILGVVQESKAEKAIEALQEMAAATSRLNVTARLCRLRARILLSAM